MKPAKGQIVKVFVKYLVIFLFGWSCAVFSYSDIIYNKAEIVSKNVVIDKGDV